MKIKIIEINDISKAIPKYKTWYKYYDDTFISVINKNNNRISHLRIKNKSRNYDNKNDNKMCYWHSNWQYSIIEKKYGIAETGNKTYEVSKQHGDLVYRIDSVVESLAIEFQHTLTVSVNELDYRYKAHKSLGYIPYLVLDLTAFEAKNTILKISDFTVDKIDYYISYSYSSLIISLLKKIRKWLNSDYYKNSSLFIDFSDVMIRFTPILKDDFLVIQKDVFVNNLLEVII